MLPLEEKNKNGMWILAGIGSRAHKMLRTCGEKILYLDLYPCCSVQFVEGLTYVTDYSIYFFKKDYLQL